MNRSTVIASVMIAFLILMCISVYSIIVVVRLTDERAHLSSMLAIASVDGERARVTNNKLLTMQKTLTICYGLSKWEAKYYAIYFNDFSEHYKIPWEIYPAIIKIESSFKTTLVSPKKCKGLMQIKEDTGKETAASMGICFVEEQSLWNEFLNLPIGCTYISRLIKDKGLIGGVSAYLGGPAYIQNLKNIEVKTYIDKYLKSVMDEYTKISYVYKGVLSDAVGIADESYTDYSNTKVKFNIDPFDQVDTTQR